jgi:hypothetical protein
MTELKAVAGVTEPKAFAGMTEPKAFAGMTIEKPFTEKKRAQKKGRLPGSRSWWSPRVSHFDAVTHLPVGGRRKYARHLRSEGCVEIRSR